MALRPLLAWLPLLLALAARARADEAALGVRLGAWGAPARGRQGADLEAAVELTPRVRLSGLVATSDGPGEGAPAELAWASLVAGAWRLEGGVTGRDGAVHVGFAPAGRLEPHPAIALEGALDLSLGAGFLGGEARARSGRHRDLWPRPVDLWAAGLAAELELQVTPWAPLLLAAGARGAGTAVAAPPVAGSSPTGLAALAREVDVGALGALSQAAVGGWLRAELRPWQGSLLGAPAALRLGYVEAWDQVHLDPLYALVREESPELGLGPIPWRTTRTGEVGLVWGGDARRLELALDLRHVRGSTTLESFGERNGWSVGGRVVARWDRLLLGASFRWALSPADVVDVVGELARAQLSCRAGVVLLDEPGLSVRAEAGVELGATDELGLPRPGVAFVGGLAFQLGAPSRPWRDPRHDPFARGVRAAARTPFVPGPGETAAALDAQALRDELLAGDGGSGAGAVEKLDGLLDRFTPQQLAGALGVELPSPEDVEAFVAGHPGLVDRIEAEYPGAGDLLRRALDDLRRPRAAAPLAAGALALGYGLQGTRAALLSARDRAATLDALTVRLDGRASDHARLDRAAGEREEQPAVELTTHRGFAGWVGGASLKKWTLLRPGSKEPWLQGQSAWSRLLHRFLTGR